MIDSHERPTVDIPADYDWQAYYHGNPIQKWWKRQIARKVVKWVYEIDGIPAIADIGCGTSPISTYCANMTGVDRDPAKVAFMREWEALNFDSDSANQYIVGDIEAGLPLADRSFDIVLSIEVAEHVAPQSFWAEIARIARPSALVIIATPDYSTTIWRLVEAVYKRMKPGQYCDDHITHYDRTKLREMGAQHGLRLVAIEYVAGCDMVAQFVKA